MKNFYGFLTNKGKNIFLITLLSTALLFASCINDLFNDDKSSKKQQTQTEQTEHTGSEELIPVKINISNQKQIENILQNVKPQKNISQARAASPWNVTLAYIILYKKVTETSPSSTVNQDNKEYMDVLTDSSAVLQLSKGTWDFTLVAYYNEKVVFTGDLLNQPIDSGNNTLNFTLEEIVGKGSIKITLVIPKSDDYTTTVQAQLKKYPSQDVIDTKTDLTLQDQGDDSDKASCVYSIGDVENGNYFAVFSITTKNLTAASDENSTETTVYPVPVRVVTNLTSESVETLSEIRNVCVITYDLGTDSSVSWTADAKPVRVSKKYQNVTLPTYESLAPIETKIFNGWKVQGGTDSEPTSTMIITENVTLEPDWITTTLYVDGSSTETESDALKTLQDAVNKLTDYEAFDGNDTSYQHDWTINVNGTCYGTSDLSSLGITKLTITGDNYTLDILDGRTSATETATDSVITNKGTYPIFIENLTIQNGNNNSGGGGGLNITKSTVYLNNVLLKGNTANDTGGGLFISNSTAYLNGVVLIDNTASENGGAIALTNSKLFIYGGCHIGPDVATDVATDTACSNKAGGNGGGIYADENSTIYFGYTDADETDETNVTLTAETGMAYNNITYNYAGGTQGGGGICCLGKLYINWGTISYNSAANGGGGIYAERNSNLYIAQGTTINYNAGSKGGGIFGNGNTTYMSGGTIYGNNASLSGGGIYLAGTDVYYGTLYMYGEAIIGTSENPNDESYYNSALYGGGIFLADSYSQAYLGYSGIDEENNLKTETLTGGVSYNQAFDPDYDGLGGGIYNKGLLQVSSGSISNNISETDGGGVYNKGDFQFSSGKIESNEAGNNGGGVYNPSGMTFTMTGGTIASNSAVNGGGVYNKGIFNVSSGNIKSNTVTDKGGGIYAASGATTDKTVLENSEITENTAKYGGGIYISEDNLYIKKATTFNENTATNSGGAVYAYYTTIYIEEQSASTYAYIEPDSNCNDVYLDEYSSITINEQLSDPYYYVARITPYSYAHNIPYIYGQECSSYYKKFLVTPQSGTNTQGMPTQVLWETTDEGKITTDNTTFVKIPAKTINETVTGSGLFMAGRELKLPSFYICDHEVTQGEYEKYCFYGVTYNWDTWTQNETTKVVKDDNYPACFVSWYDAIVYCNLRSIAEGLDPVYYFKDTSNGTTTLVTHPADWGNKIVTGTTEDGEIRYRGPSPDDTEDPWSEIKQDYKKSGWRLPLEAEWEYAARGANGADGTSAIETCLYSGSDNSEVVAWMGSNAKIGTDYYPHEVKKLAANRLGLYDMSGNVVELCWDWYSDDLSTAAITGPESNTNLKVAAPGGAYQWPRTLKAYTAGEDPPGRSSNPKNARFNNAGFRIVRTITE